MASQFLNRKMPLLVGLMSMFDNFGRGERKTRIEDIDFTPKEAPIQKGCKQYFFTEDGDFTNDYMRVIDVFTCTALNDRNAIRKFNNWKAKQAA